MDTSSYCTCGLGLLSLPFLPPSSCPSPFPPSSPPSSPSPPLPSPVSQPQHLMPAVISGDLTRVHSIISHLANDLSNQSRKSPQFHQSTKTATVGESSTSLETRQPLTESPDQVSEQPRPPLTHEQPLAPPAKRSRISTEKIVADSAVSASKPSFATLSSADVTSIDFDAELPVLSTEAVVGGVSRGWGLEVLYEKTDQNCTILHVCGRIDHAHSSKGKGQVEPHPASCMICAVFPMIFFSQIVHLCWVQSPLPRVVGVVLPKTKVLRSYVSSTCRRIQTGAL